ncbi:MAG: spermidine/putrescine ABC transporter substrate-binding protein [Oscillospiraceae bacterium]|nr:spermidine/putrescine ABC transporter substrate-binding protein [Oscillospiraceae bacterium]
MKKILGVFFVCFLAFAMCLPAFAETATAEAAASGVEPRTPGSDDVIDDAAYENKEPDIDLDALRGTSVNVYNWGEYMAVGKDGAQNLNKIFTDKYGIVVNYSVYENNETMYSKIKGGGVSYDIIIPSDYMVARLIKEGLVQKLDFKNIPNYSLVPDEYRDLYFDPDNEYSVPYAAGMVGIIYNTKMVDGRPDSWGLMWDEQYSGKILTFNNPRDTFATAQFLNGTNVNSENEAGWRAAAEKLNEQKPLIQSYVMDEIFDKMEGGNAAIAPYYAGDFLSMYENNKDLAFFYPKEGTNIFVDSICIPKNAKNMAAAELYINFLLSPDAALENAEYIRYASPNLAVLNNDDYSLKDEKLLYPAPEDMPKVEYFENLSPEALQLMSELWDDLKISNTSYTSIYIGASAAAVLIIAMFAWKYLQKKKRAQ